MPNHQVFQQSILIDATPTTVERCITDLKLMHQWLNPVLRCEPVDEWCTDVGCRSRFIIQIPLLSPCLNSVIVERQPGLIVWQFQGFFQGRDRWECQPDSQGTRLINCFEFEIPSPVVRWGFNTFAAAWTKADMRSQLERLKQIAEGGVRDEG